MSRVDRHLHSLMKQINPLRNSVAEADKRVATVDKEIEHYKNLMERHKREHQEDIRRVEYKAKEVTNTI